MTGTVGDRVKETSTTVGSGDFTLLGAPAKFDPISTGIGNGVWFGYTIVHEAGTQWETGFGYLNGTSTLVRADPRAGSNGPRTLNSFVAGTKDVFCSLIASAVTTRGQLLAAARNANWP